MCWQKESDRKAGGYWRCLVRKRERQRVRTDKTRARNLRHYHAPNGGYIRRRRADLSAQRAQILERLVQLEREKESCR